LARNSNDPKQPSPLKTVNKMLRYRCDRSSLPPADNGDLTINPDGLVFAVSPILSNHYLHFLLSASSPDQKLIHYLVPLRGHPEAL
jgi:hypothetical protein